MNRLRLVAVATAALAISVPSMVLADTYWDVEAARANARAGGPTNAYDADLLARYGCLSGTTASSFCQRLSHGDYSGYYDEDAPRRYSKPRRQR
jgi:hypothetical protein